MIAAAETQVLIGVALTAAVTLLLGILQWRTTAKKSVVDTLMTLNEQQNKKIAALETSSKECHDANEALRRQNGEQQDQINGLKAQVATLMQGEKFWKDRYHELKDEMA